MLPTAIASQPLSVSASAATSRVGLRPARHAIVRLCPASKNSAMICA
jgi:hypothetical protein